jgi:hypothetical protein
MFYLRNYSVDSDLGQFGTEMYIISLQENLILWFLHKRLNPQITRSSSTTVTILLKTGKCERNWHYEILFTLRFITFNLNIFLILIIIGETFFYSMQGERALYDVINFATELFKLCYTTWTWTLRMKYNYNEHFYQNFHFCTQYWSAITFFCFININSSFTDSHLQELTETTSVYNVSCYGTNSFQATTVEKAKQRSIM